MSRGQAFYLSQLSCGDLGVSKCKIGSFSKLGLQIGGGLVLQVRHRHYGTPERDGWRGGGRAADQPRGGRSRRKVGAPGIRRVAREGGVAVVRCRRFRRRFGQSGPNLLPDRMAFGHHSLGWFALIFSAPLLLGFPARYKRCKGIACRRGNGRAYSQI